MQNRRPKRRDFPIGSFLSIAIMLAIVVTIGILAYGKLSNIAETVSNAARVDGRLLLVKGITSDLSDAENSVKTFSLTGDTTDLDPFYSTVATIDGKLTSLLSFPDAENRYGDLDFMLDSLIREKFALQSEQVAMRGGNRVNVALEKLSRTIRRAETTAAENPTETAPPPRMDTSSKIAVADSVEVEKKGIVGRLFSGKKKEARKKRRADRKANGKSEAETPEAAPDSMIVVRDSIAEPIVPSAPELKAVIEREISSIKVKEQRLSKSLIERSLQLIGEEQLISQQIHTIELQIEEIERNAIAAKTLAAEQATLQVNRLVLVFSISVALLLFLLGLGIYFYFRTTNRYQQGIQNARNEAENLAKARERFLATMSHEIRTPMNAIVGFSDLLLKTPLAPEQQDKLQLVKRSADHLLSVVDSVLVYARLAATQLQFEQQAFQLKSTVRLPLDLISRDANQKGLELKFTYPDGLPDIVEGDALRLRQVLLNLLGNAVKFTAKGSIELRVAQIYHRTNEVRLRFSVIDTGVGIPGPQKERVFNEFEQSETSTTRKYGGTGLGLSISRHIVMQQGGKIGLTSKEGEGTTVFFELPLAIGSQELPVVEQVAGAAAADWSGKHILIADDEDYNRKLLNEILRKRNATTSTVSNGVQALEALKNKHFDLVLMDIRMPEMNGLEATRRIRKREAGKSNRKIPVVALTAGSTAAEMENCQSAGCNQVLQKPFAEADLIHAIQQLLQIPPSTTDSQNDMTAETDTNSPLSQDSELNLQPLLQMSRGDNNFVREMLTSYLASLEGSEVVIEAGFAEQDHKAVAEAAHKLAAPSRHLNAESLYKVLKEIEQKCDDELDWPQILPLKTRFEVEGKRVKGWIMDDLRQLEGK